MWAGESKGVVGALLVGVLCACGDEITNHYNAAAADGGAPSAPTGELRDGEPTPTMGLDAGARPTPTPPSQSSDDDCDCEPDSCTGNGECLCAGGSSVCLCDPGFAGRDCDGCAPGHSRTLDGDACAAFLQLARVEPAGSDCPSGGVAIESGLDLDGDGSLQSDEVTETTHVCNASGRSDTCQSADCTCEDTTCNGHGACVSGTTGLVCLCDAGHGGARCEACQTGHIEAADGTCKLPAELTAVEAELAGDNCSQGGDVVLRGLDLNDNGSLEPDEVASRSYRCTNAVVRSGTLVVRNQAELDDLADVTTIEGSLTISARHITDLSPLSRLTRITDFLRVMDNPDLVSVAELANLAEVGDSVVVARNDSLPDLSGLNGLVRVGASLEVHDNGALTDITGFDGVARIRGNLLVSGNAMLADLSGLGGLQYVGGRVHIEHNPALADVTGLGALISVVDRMVVQDNPALKALSGLSNLDAVGGPLIVYANDALENLDGLSKLRDTDALVIEGNAALADIDGLVSLRSLRNGLYLRDNGALSTLAALPALIAIDGDLVIHNNDALSSITGFAALTYVEGAIVITDNGALQTIDAWNGLEQLGLLAWPGFPCGAVALAGALYSNVPSDYRFLPGACLGYAPFSYASPTPRFSTGCNLPLLPHVNTARNYSEYYDYALPCAGVAVPNYMSLRVAGNGMLRTLGGFRALTQLEALWVQDNPALQRIDDLPVSTAGILQVDALPQLTSFNSLTTIEDATGIAIYGSGLRSFDLQSLDTVGTLTVVANPELTEMNAAPDAGVISVLTVQDNPKLPSCEAHDFADAHLKGSSSSIARNYDAGVCP